MAQVRAYESEPHDLIIILAFEPYTEFCRLLEQNIGKLTFHQSTWN